MIDFGTVRDLGKASGPLTTYVSTRWYRSPE
jgi:serine/threonine protein kinase